MSGRIGALNTAGSGCVDPLGVPSCEAIVTVGRVAIVAVFVEMGGTILISMSGGEVQVWEPIYASLASY